MRAAPIAGAVGIDIATQANVDTTARDSARSGSRDAGDDVRRSGGTGARGTPWTHCSGETGARMKNASVEDYLRDGCGRCDLFRTAECKVHRWQTTLVALRKLVRSMGLEEHVKWGSPCYALDGKNVVMVSAFKEYCALQFFEGAALADPDGCLESAGASSRHVRFLKFRSAADVKARTALAKGFVEQAMARVRAGEKWTPPPPSEPVPDELQARLAVDAALRRAFDALTPGRRRSHILHIGGAKQSETRARRVERCAPEILAGRGFNER